MDSAESIGQRFVEIPLDIAATNGTAEIFTRQPSDHRQEKQLANGRNPAAHLTLQKLLPGSIAEPRVSFLDRVWGEWIMAPFFLFSSLGVILLVPEKLVKKVTAPFSGINFWEQFGKRMFDFVMAVLGFILSSILFFIVPILIKADSNGPVFYGQQRVGLNHRRRDRRQVAIHVQHERRRGERRRENLHGRPFIVYKFRTMCADAEKRSGAVWAQKNDPRVTRTGNVLRFTHVDEIPQFLNVLLGEMSMVGPRPERPQIIPKLTEQIHQYGRRLEVKPGMTGIAQIYCGYDVTIDDVREKLRYDLSYVNNHSLKSDVIILFKTLWMIIRGREKAD